FAMILLTVITNTGTSQYPPCYSYNNISDSWRNVGFCHKTVNKSDINLVDGWYRFIGVGGDQVVASCAQANMNGNVTIYNLFTCNSSINYTDYTTCSGGFTVYHLRPTEKTYATRHSHCTNSSCGTLAQCGIVYGSCVCEPGLDMPDNFESSNTYGCSVLNVSDSCQTTECASQFLSQIEILLNNTEGSLPQTIVESYLMSAMKVTTKIVERNSTNNSELISYGNQLLAITEKLLGAVVIPTFTQNNATISLSSMEAEIFTVGSNTTLSKIPPLQTSNSSLNIDLIGISKNNNGSASVVFVNYYNMDSILKPSFFNTTTSSVKTMMSNVVSVTLPKVTNTELNKPINLTFKYTNTFNPEGNFSCVYWNEFEWIENGCKISEKNSSYTICSCVHLSTFALIMQTDPDVAVSEDDFTKLLNTVAVSVGLVFLTLTVVTLAVCQRGPKITNAALLNLCISLFFAHLTFLLTEKFLQNVKEDQVCLVLAGVIHFLFLSAFVWMFIEAVLLYIFVKNLSRISSRQNQVLSWKCMIVIGYVIPLAMVGVTSGLCPDAYNSETCWLDQKYVWIFLGPVACIIGINLLLSCVIFMNLKWALSRLDKTVSQLKHTQTLVFKTMLQFVILGCPWVLGFFVEGSFMIKIVFLFLNSQQGTFIFIVHCVLNQE
ncbi:adhesion G protein-coupled receptor E3-like, partial [Clarias magur]